MGLSFLIGALVVFLYTGNLETSTLPYSMIAIIFFIVVLALLFFVLQKVFPAKDNGRFLLWLGALGAGVLLTFLLSPFMSVFFSAYGTVPPSGTIGSFRVYEDSVLGFRISYPGTWTLIKKKDSSSDLITNTAFISRDGKTVATVQVTDFSGSGYLGVPLDTWTTHTIGVLTSNSISSQFTLLGSERTVFAGYPAQMLDYTVVLNSGDHIRTIEYLVEAGSKGYNVGFTSREDDFNDTAGTRQQVINSFIITE